MTSDEPGPTLEGQLIKRVRESLRPRVTAAEAAERAGISAEMWGHIERGHRSAGKGKGRVPVRATRATLAHMAFEIGVTAADLEEAGRGDAAEVLRAMDGVKAEASPLDVVIADTDRGRVWFAVRPGLSDEKRALLQKWAEDMGESLYQDELAAQRLNKAKSDRQAES